MKFLSYVKHSKEVNQKNRTKLNLEMNVKGTRMTCCFSFTLSSFLYKHRSPQQEFPAPRRITKNIM